MSRSFEYALYLYAQPQERRVALLAAEHAWTSRRRLELRESPTLRDHAQALGEPRPGSSAQALDLIYVNCPQSPGTVDANQGKASE